VKKLSAPTAYYLNNIFGAFNSGLIITALYVYYARTIEMTPLQLSLMGTVLMVTSLLFEVPTGVVADVYSRKASVIIGGMLSGLAFILIGAIPLYAVVLVAAFIEAVGDTFISGALDAWLADEVGADNVGAVILRAEQWGTLPHLAGVATSVVLSTLFSHPLPIVLGGVLKVLAMSLLLILMPETKFVRRARTDTSITSSVQHMLSTLRAGIQLVRTRRTLLLLFIAQLFMGAFLEGFFRLNQLHLFTGFALPTLRVPWLGVLDESAWAAFFGGFNSLLYLLGIALLRRWVDLSDAQRAPSVLLIMFAIIGAGALTFALSPSFGVAAVALCITATLHNMTEPLVRTWLNQHITKDESAVRATVLSMNSQANQLGQLGGGLGIGALGNVAGLRVALAASALFLLPLLGLLRRTDKEVKP
jgi:MFS transporter, DHA3 family, tetracycline resistance protein